MAQIVTSLNGGDTPLSRALFGMLARNLRPNSPAYLTMSAACLRTIETNRNLVLVVDDDPGMLRGVQRLLRQHAYQPILFSSAQAFKSHTDFEKAACVILDINLNDGSGIDLRHRLKADGHSVPVIYMTASDNPAVRKAALDSGCIAFLTKPFLVQELIDRSKELAGTQQRRHALTHQRVCHALCGPSVSPDVSRSLLAKRK
jgi:DNA-binding response OmpR family regulator